MSVFSRMNTFWKKPTSKTAVLCGSGLFTLHLLLALLIFFSVQSSSDGQAGFAWFIFFVIDWPSGDIAYGLLGNTAPMAALVKWWYQFGQGPNIRALLLFGIFGGMQWFVIGAFLGGCLSWLRERWRQHRA